MHFVQLVDSIVLLYPTPKTIHKLHPYYHQLRKTSSLEEATNILSKEYDDTVYYLYSQPTGILVKQPEGSIAYPTNATHFDATSQVATFTSIEEAIDTYPELFI